MKARSRAVPLPKANANKYFSYREAWGRIRKAQGHGFYLEAVTLEESIIADRLISFLIRSGVVQADARVERQGFGQLVQLWVKSVPDPIPTKYSADLRLSIDEWRKGRNEVIHGMAKSVPCSDHKDPLDFLSKAKAVAVKGEVLALDVSSWCRKVKRQLAKAKSVPETLNQRA